jgi:hypothetical protein
MNTKAAPRATENRRFATLETAIGIGAIVVLVLLIAFRITRGVDLSDESYYAIFIDDWLKGGIAASASLSVHQTAALLVYPAALLYTKIVGSSDGMFLFLRVIFLVGATTSSCFWIAFLLRLGYRSLAWANGLAVLAFIPFGLPAPSYNTIALQALVVALASFGCACLTGDERGGVGQRPWMMVSAAAWAIASVAYPPIVVMPFLVVLLCLCGTPFPRPLTYLTSILAAIGIASAVVILMLTPGRLHEIYPASNTALSAGVVSEKLAFVGQLISTHLVFVVLCLLSIAVGALRLLFPTFAQFAIAILVLCLFATGPALFVRSHDAVTLVALGGIGLLARLRSSAARQDRIISAVYAISLGAAVIICATASNAVYNFAVGAMPAAAVSLLGPSNARYSLASWMSTLATGLLLLSTSLFFHYGEWPKPLAGRERITDGFFAGLAVSPSDIAILRLVETRLAPILGDTQSFAVIGRFPGLVLATKARLLMLSAYSIPAAKSAGKLERARAFYQTRQPDYVAIYRDPYFQFVNPIPDFDRRYRLISSFPTPLGSLELLQRSALDQRPRESN